MPPPLEEGQECHPCVPEYRVTYLSGRTELFKGSMATSWYKFEAPGTFTVPEAIRFSQPAHRLERRGSSTTPPPNHQAVAEGRLRLGDLKCETAKECRRDDLSSVCAYLGEPHARPTTRSSRDRRNHVPMRRGSDLSVAISSPY